MLKKKSGGWRKSTGAVRSNSDLAVDAKRALAALPANSPEWRAVDSLARASRFPSARGAPLWAQQEGKRRPDTLPVRTGQARFREKSQTISEGFKSGNVTSLGNQVIAFQGCRRYPVAGRSSEL